MLRNTIVEGSVPVRDDVGAQPSGVRGGHLDGVRRRLGVPRRPPSAEGLSMMATMRYLVSDVGAATRSTPTVWDSRSSSATGRRSRSCVGTLDLWLAGPTSSAARAMPDGREPAPGGWNRLVIEVEDLDATVAQLGRGGAVFRNEIVEGPGGRQILVEDPSGQRGRALRTALLSAWPRSGPTGLRGLAVTVAACLRPGDHGSLVVRERPGGGSSRRCGRSARCSRPRSTSPS